LEPYIRHITQQVLSEGLPEGVCLNVNFPLLEASGEGKEVGNYRGIRVCRMSKGTWGNEVTRCHHPRGYDYWWMVGSYHNDEPEATDTDRWALDHGYIAITPTQIDVTAYEAIEMLKSWNL
jgi:5'-nucleotidase